MDPISGYMTRKTVAVETGTLLTDAIQLMRQKKIGAVLVNGPKGKFTGIFTERDLMTRLDYKAPERFKTLRVKDIMTKNVITVDADKPFTEVIKLMQQYNIRHMPVTQDGKVAGIVSLRDLMIRYEENLEHLLGEKEAQLIENFQRLRESEERIRMIFRNTAVAIVFVDNNERVVSWNPLTEELLGMDDQDLRNKPVKDMFPQEEWKNIREMNIREHGGYAHMETKVFNRKGHAIDVELSISFIKDSSGRMAGSIGVLRDIRKRRQIEKKLHESLQSLESEYKTLKEYQRQIIQMEKMVTMGTLAAGFAHEIKNPLAIILQGTEQIQKSSEKRQDSREGQFVGIIRNAANRANEVVTSILKYSRAAQMEVRPVNIRETIDATVELIKNHDRADMVKIRTKYPPRPPSIEGDAIMIQQVFFDLMMNALDAMPRGGAIDVSVRTSQLAKDRKKKIPAVVVRVKDTGEGIPSAFLPKIFDPFFTTKDAGKGTGLGLSTVYLIVEKHRGTIDVKSRKGKGTTFTVTLPLEQKGPPVLKQLMSNGGKAA